MAARILVTSRAQMENGRKPSAPPALDSAYLENKFQPELNVATLSSRLGQGHRDRIGSETDGGGSRIDIWCLEIGMVEDVKELRTELQAKPLCYHGVLEDRKVKVHQSGTQQSISSIRAHDRTGGCHGKWREAIVVQVHHSRGSEVSAVGIASGQAIRKRPWVRAVLT